MNLLSPQAYERALKSIFSKGKQLAFKVKDVFVVPNYKKFLRDHIDLRFQGWTRGESTQLQWKFEKAPEEHRSFFPLGVRVQYRAFCSDETIEIRDISNSAMIKLCVHLIICVYTDDIPRSKWIDMGILVGFQAAKTMVSWQPKISVFRPKGMHILTSFPVEPFEPDIFIQGSRQRLMKLVTSIRTNFSFKAGRDYNPTSEWDLFASDCAPLTDSANEFVTTKGLHCPLGKILLGSEDLTHCTPVALSSSAENSLPVCRTGNSVAWYIYMRSMHLINSK